MSPEQLHQKSLRRERIDGIREKRTSDIRTDSKIAVLGLERPGLSFSIHAAARGFQTVGYEADEVKAAQLEEREAAYLEDEDQELFKRARRLLITADATELEDSNYFLIYASTPNELEGYLKTAGEYLKAGGTVIVESVVSPGVCEHILLPILKKASALPQNEFYFAHAPLRDAASDETRIIGAENRESFLKAAELYRSVLGISSGPMLSLQEAEILPMIEASFADINLALAAEFSIALDRINLDLSNVLAAAGMQEWHGGIANAKSAQSFYFTRAEHSHELDQPLLTSARRSIERMPEYAVKVLSDLLREKKMTLKGATVALLGLSREDDISKNEDPAALKMRAALKKRGATVKVFDPYVASAGHDLKEALEDADAVLIATDHAMFCNLQPRHFEEAGISIVVDACNCVDKELFANSSVLYRGIGRG